jgi:hypothetical protein
VHQGNNAGSTVVDRKKGREMKGRKGKGNDKGSHSHPTIGRALREGLPGYLNELDF